MSDNLLAARHVVRHSTSAADARQLLSMLGLIDGNRIAPDMDAVRLARRVNEPLPKAQVPITPTQGDIRQRPKHSTAPEGLRVLPPVVEAPKAKTPRPRSAAQMAGPPQGSNDDRTAPCGTETAAKRHKRNNQVNPDGSLACRTCQAGRDERRHVARPMRLGSMTAGARCGTRYGYDDHLRRNEATCQPCRDAIAADARRREALRKGKPLKPATVHRQCGTSAGRGIHRRRGEQCCDPCRAARNQSDRERTA